MAKVLCVDDDGDVAEVLAEMVEFAGRDTQHGHEAVICTDAFVAVELLKQDRDIRVLVTDYMMPRLDGIELLVIAQEVRPDVRRILVTAAPNESAVKDALRTGVTQLVIAKPPRLAQMQLAVAWL